MPVEPLVLCRHDRVFQGRSNGVRRNLPAELIAPPREDLAVTVQNGHRSAGTAIKKLADGGQVDVEISANRPDQQYKDKRDTAADIPCKPSEPTEDAPKESGQKISALAPGAPRTAAFRRRCLLSSSRLFPLTFFTR